MSTHNIDFHREIREIYGHPYAQSIPPLPNYSFVADIQLDKSSFRICLRH